MQLLEALLEFEKIGVCIRTIQPSSVSVSTDKRALIFYDMSKVGRLLEEKEYYN